MAWVRVTLLKPAPGYREDALAALRELDEFLADEPGLVMSLVFHDDESVGRISVWEKESEPNRAAQEEMTLAIRSRLQAVPGTHEVELLAEADAGTWSPGALGLLASTLGWRSPQA